MCFAPELNVINLIRSFTPGAKVNILAHDSQTNYLFENILLLTLGMNSPTSRLFVALPVTSQLLSSINRLKLLNENLEGVRWTPPDNLHLTLFFLGEVNPINVSEIINLMNEVPQQEFHINFHSFSLEGGRPYHPSMIWAKFNKHPQFTQLSLKLRKSFEPFISEPMKFSEPIPHITVARIKKVQDFMLNVQMNEPFIVNGMELWQSVRTSTGVTYPVLAKKY